MKTVKLPFMIFALWFVIPRLSCASTFAKVVQKPHLLKRSSSLHEAKTDFNKCDQTSIPVMESFDIERFAGSWYELAKVVSGHIDADDGIWKLTIPKNSKKTLSFMYTGRESNNHCIKPISGIISFIEETPGELNLKYQTYSAHVSETLRVLFTDYNQIAVLYSCLHFFKSGKCHNAGIFASIWTRQPHVDVKVYEQALSVLDKACVDKTSLTIRNRVGPCEFFEFGEMNGEEIENTFDKRTACLGTAACALHCSPCCRENTKGCVECSCETIIVDEFVTCLGSPAQCPLRCEPRELREGCYICACDSDIPETDYHDETGVCLENWHMGQCGGRIERYYYNAIAGNCQKFNYTGCGGNSNNFQTLEECLSKCKGIQAASPKENTDGAQKNKIHSFLIIAAFIIVFSIF